MPTQCTLWVNGAMGQEKGWEAFSEMTRLCKHLKIWAIEAKSSFLPSSTYMCIMVSCWRVFACKDWESFSKAAFFMQLLLQREVWGLLILSCVFAQSCVEAQLCNYGVDSLARQPSSTSLTMSSEMWTDQQLCLGLIEIMFKWLRIEWRHCCFYQASPSWSVDESPALWRQYRKNRQVKQGRRQVLRSLRSSLPYQGHGSLFPTYQIPLACLDKKP